MLMRTIGCLLVLAVSVPAQTDPYESSVKIEDSSAPSGAKAKFDTALSMVEGLAAGLAADDPLKKKLETIIKKYKETVIPGGALRVSKEAMGTTNGYVHHSGNSPGKKTVILDSGLFAGSSRGALFYQLMDTIVHEGIHLYQDLPFYGGASPSPKETFELKRSKIEGELQAYTGDMEFQDSLAEIISKMKVNLRSGKPATGGLPTWTAPWAAATKDEVSEMDGARSAIVAGKGDRLKALSYFVDPKTGKVYTSQELNQNMAKAIELTIKTLKPGQPVPTTDLEKAEALIDYTTAMVQVGVTPGPGKPPDPTSKQYMWISPGEDRIRVTDGRIIRTGIDALHSARLIHAADDAIWLVACGLDDKAEFRGVVRLIPFDSKAGQKDRTIVRDDPRLPGATSLVVVRERVYVYSPSSRALLQLTDSDSDGLPDALGPMALANVPQSLDFDLATQLEEVGGDLVALPGFLTPERKVSPWVTFRDTNSDGVFDTTFVVQPQDWQKRTPHWLGRPQAQGTVVGIAASRTHQFAIIGHTPGGADELLAQGAMPQSESDELLVALSRPLRPGEQLDLRDLTNQLSTPNAATGQRTPVVLQTIPSRILTDGTGHLRILGDGYESVQAVKIAGVSVQFQVLSPREILAFVPDLPYAAGYELSFVQQGGAEVASDFELFDDLSEP